jgi:hypothetical protein
MQCRANGLVGDACVDEGLVEAFDGAIVHVAVDTVAAVYAHHHRFATERLRVSRRTSERLGQYAPRRRV